MRNMDYIGANIFSGLQCQTVYLLEMRKHSSTFLAIDYASRQTVSGNPTSLTTVAGTNRYNKRILVSVVYSFVVSSNSQYKT